MTEKAQKTPEIEQQVFKPDEIQQFQENLLKWYQNHSRDLPWRESNDPYRIWVSEIMLQQTRVDTVIPYYLRFITRIPTVRDLSIISDDELLKIWQGLGYYGRVKNMKKAAGVIVNQMDGTIPDDFVGLKSLPGIGEYTAGAIGSIAFGLIVPAIDGNVLRVIARVTSDFGDINSIGVKKRLGIMVKSLLPDKQIGDFNQALMELGALICLPNGKPTCSTCPIRILCKACLQNLTDIIPVKQEKKARRIEEKTVLFITAGDRIALRKRQETGLLAGLWEFPHFEGFQTELFCRQYLTDLNLRAIEIKPLKKSRYIFSHLEWTILGFEVRAENTVNTDDWIWATREEIINTYSVPTAYRYFTELFLNKSPI